jgi:hypothetical protein
LKDPVKHCLPLYYKYTYALNLSESLEVKLSFPLFFWRKKHRRDNLKEQKTADKSLMSTPISKTSEENWDVDRAMQSDGEPRRHDQVREAFRSLSTSANWMDWFKFGPVGWRFNPSDIELLDYYLRARKYGGGAICEGIFGDFDLYKYDPQNLPQGRSRFMFFFE